MKTYGVQLEIAGPTALWSRPDTAPHPVSYPAPTCSAAKGIFESVLRWKSVEVRPIACEICKPVRYHRYAFNYGGPLRKSKLLAMGASHQVFAVVLVDVCYRLFADVGWAAGAAGGRQKAPGGVFAPHAYQDAFERRLLRGRWFCTPCLGWKEFVPDYVGPFRPESTPCTAEEHVIPAFLHSVFDPGGSGARRPSFRQQVRIVGGRLGYQERGSAGA